jgi:hypothetical protein
MKRTDYPQASTPEQRARHAHLWQLPTKTLIEINKHALAITARAGHSLMDSAALDVIADILRSRETTSDLFENTAS